MAIFKQGVEQRAGGLYGINVETLGAGKTLTPGVDKIYQYLDEGGDNRTITLATAGAQAGDRFVIRHNGAYNDTHYLQIMQAAAMRDRIYAGAIRAFIFDGTDWFPERTGTGETDDKKYNLALGYQAQGYAHGVALGYTARAYSYGVAVGDTTKGYAYGVAVGAQSTGYSYGIALGYSADTTAKKFSIALGSHSTCARTAETAININGDDGDQENNVVQGRWEKETANNTPIEMFCGGQANQRFIIRVQSALAFRMTIVARDNVAGHVAMYTVVDGLIKRDGANNTVMSNCTVTTVHEDDAAWDVAVTADDTNEALIITVTGDAANPTQWAAVMDGVETHF